MAGVIEAGKEDLMAVLKDPSKDFVDLNETFKRLPQTVDGEVALVRSAHPVLLEHFQKLLTAI